MALIAPSALAHRCSLFTMKTPASDARVFEWDSHVVSGIALAQCTFCCPRPRTLQHPWDVAVYALS